MIEDVENFCSKCGGVIPTCYWCEECEIFVFEYYGDENLLCKCIDYSNSNLDGLNQ